MSGDRNEAEETKWLEAEKAAGRREQGSRVGQ